MTNKPRNWVLLGITMMSFSCFMASSLLVRQVGFEASLLTHYSGRIVEILICFLIAFIARKASINPNKIFFLSIGALVVTLTFEFIGPLFSDANTSEYLPVLDALSGIFYGIYLACTSLLFARLVSTFSVREAAVVIPLSWAGSHLIFLFSFLLPQQSYFWMKIILITVTALTLYFCLQSVCKGKDIPRSLKPRKETLRIIPLLKDNKYFSLYFGMLVFPFFYGLMAQICSHAEIHAGLFAVSSEIVGIVFLLLLALSVPLWKNMIDTEGVFIIVLPIFTTAFLLSPFFWGSEVFVSGFIAKCGFLIYAALMWIYMQRMTHKAPDQSFFFFGIALGVFYLALMGGRLSAQVLILDMGLLDEMVAFASLLAVWLLSMSVLVVLLVNRRYKNKASSAPQKSASLDFDVACASFGAHYHLSERELSVVKEYARGRTASYIAQELVVSEETVRTYLKRSYSKSSCHSRQDLLDKLEAIAQQER